VLVEFTYQGVPKPYLTEWLDFREGKLYPNDRPGLGVDIDVKQLKPVTEITQRVTARAQVYYRPDGSITNW
jgi:L-alanine-DL-glutamate epimerase-like enolase superfamily enzyme